MASVPALTYGPGDATAGTLLGMLLDDLERAARSYALIGLNMCTQVKKRAGKQGRRGGWPPGEAPVASNRPGSWP